MDAPPELVSSVGIAVLTVVEPFVSPVATGSESADSVLVEAGAVGRVDASESVPGSLLVTESDLVSLLELALVGAPVLTCPGAGPAVDVGAGGKEVLLLAGAIVTVPEALCPPASPEFCSEPHAGNNAHGASNRDDRIRKHLVMASSSAGVSNRAIEGDPSFRSGLRTSPPHNAPASQTYTTT